LQELLLKGKCKSIYGTSEDFQEFANTIVTFRLIDKSVEDVGNGPTNKGTATREFSVDAMQNGLEIIALWRILAIKDFDQLQAKLLIDIFLGSHGIDFGRNNKAEKEFIGNLQMRPGRFQDGFIFFGSKLSVAGGKARQTLAETMAMRSPMTDSVKIF
jgi:hypothetical protein